MKKPLPPCMDCEVRVVGCHAACKLYARFVEETKRYKHEVYLKTAGGQMADAFAHRVRRKMKKKDHLPRIR